MNGWQKVVALIALLIFTAAIAILVGDAELTGWVMVFAFLLGIGVLSE